jgi:DNA-binding response OmpR family regulator
LTDEGAFQKMSAAMASTPLVLVADDEPQMRDIVAGHLRTLADPRLDVVEAADGEQAWKLALEKLPDLVVLDVRMPEMSGWEVCKKIREAVELAHTGVIMLTGIGERLNEITSPLYGADAYIDKPFEFTELDRKVKDVLAERAPQRNAVPRPRENGVHAPARPAKPLLKAAKLAKAEVAKGKGKPSKSKAKLKATPPKKAAAPVKKAAKKVVKAAASPKKAAKPAKKVAKKAPAKKAAKPAKKKKK